MKQTTKKVLVLLLAFVLVVTCFPIGAFAADDESGSSGSEIGSGSDGKGNAAGKGSSYMIAAGVTMQVVYYRYDQCYNRYNSHGSVVDTVRNHNAIPWNDTGKDIGETATTVFDTFTLTPHTFLVKAMWHDYPYVYHFPNETLQEDLCTFDWLNFDDYWFDDEEQNPGGKPYTYSLVVRNEENGSIAIEKFLARIILGSRYGEWDKLDVAKGETVETDTSLFAAVLKYLGASDVAIQNYLDSYYGKLSVSQDGDTLIPTIIWSWVAAENLGRVSRIYTIGDVAANGTENADWLSTTYTSGKNCNTGFKPCSWMEESTDTMICKLMLGGEHDYRHGTTIWTAADSSNLYGTGLVNRIQTEVDSTAENGTNTFYYLRGYWTPYGMGTGSVSLTKTNVEGTENLAGAEFTLYRDAACTVPVTEQDYSKLSTSDAGYVSPGVRSTDASGKCAWTGLYSGIYFLKETKAPEGYRVNTDSSGKVEVKTVSVKDGETGMTLTNAENTIPVTLQKSISAPDACIQQILGNPLYSLAGAEYTVSLNGTVVETLVTDENGKAVSNRPYNIGDVLTIRETKAPKGFKLDTSPYTHTVTADSNEISVTDIPIFDPPFVLTKVDKDTTTPQGGASFAGAVFKWEYFPNGDWSGSPARSWYFATDASGRCLYSQDYLAAGYEKKLCTYPRTDSRFLTEDMADTVPELVAVAGTICSKENPGTMEPKRVCNSSKVSDHHAIVPTLGAGQLDMATLPKGEQAILKLLSLQLLKAVSLPHKYAETVIALECEGQQFTAKGKTVLEPGWKSYEPVKEEKTEKLPDLKVGQKIPLNGVAIKEGKTTPPKHYTEDTLLSSMETAGVQDMPEEAERKGLGTPATRAGILEKLISAGFAERRKAQKQTHLVPTANGMALITVLPEALQSPLLTAEWENKLTQIQKGELSPDAFLGGIVTMLRELIHGYKPIPGTETLFLSGKEVVGSCPRCGNAVTEAKKGFFCENPGCSFALWKENRFFTAKKKELTKSVASDLLRKGSAQLKGCYSPKTGTTYNATVILADDGNQTDFKLDFGSR